MQRDLDSVRAREAQAPAEAAVANSTEAGLILLLC